MPAQKNGMRFLVASDGVWREVTMPWLHVLQQVSESTIQLPYGNLGQDIRLKCSQVPVTAWGMFKDDALNAAPKEMAAALIWNEHTDTWRYALRTVVFASEDVVDYLEVALRDGEHLVFDLHSHGHDPAFFSPKDDRDDRGTIRFSGVIGSLKDEQPTFKLRLNVAGFRFNAALTASCDVEVLG